MIEEDGWFEWTYLRPQQQARRSVTIAFEGESWEFIPVATVRLTAENVKVLHSTAVPETRLSSIQAKTIHTMLAPQANMTAIDAKVLHSANPPMFQTAICIKVLVRLGRGKRFRAQVMG